MRATLLVRFAFAAHSRYCIVGLGSGGLCLTSHLLRSGVDPSEIRVIDPAPKHYYQPGFTMVGANFWNITSFEQPMESVVPKNVVLQKERVKLVKAQENKVVCESGQEFTYDQLILGTGMRLQYERVQGLRQALDDPNSKVASIYELKYAQKVAKLAKKLKKGKAIFTEPEHPLKCAGAPQKIMYLWTNKWRRNNLPIDVELMKTNALMFSVPKYADQLTKVAELYKIKVTFQHALVKVVGDQATFQNTETLEHVVKKFDFLHAVPPMGPHDYILQSGLADGMGYLDCDKHTLRHVKFKNIWGIGDCTNLPNSKTAAAAFAQALVLHDNLMGIRRNPNLIKLPSSYEGYASCPLFIGGMHLVLAEFKYDGVIDQTFYNDQEKPRFQFYLMKRFFFPLAYKYLLPRGMWKGRKGIRWTK